MENKQRTNPKIRFHCLKRDNLYGKETVPPKRIFINLNLVQQKEVQKKKTIAAYFQEGSRENEDLVTSFLVAMKKCRGGGGDVFSEKRKNSSDLHMKEILERQVMKACSFFAI